MRPFPAVALTACTAAILALVVHPGAASASASPSRIKTSAPVNLIANPSFGANPPLSRWTCDDRTTVDTLQEGVEFIQIGPRDDAGPLAAATPDLSVAAARASAASDTYVGRGMFSPYDNASLVGTPDDRERATCSQVVPVRPRSTYTLSVHVYGGTVVLGSDYGVVQGGSGDTYTLLSTTFTTGWHADRVRVYVQGVLGGEAYEVDDVTLTGPDSASRVPAVPSGLASHPYTSRALMLVWVGSPGASRYRVFRDGCLVAATSNTWLPVYGLTAGRAYDFAVEAVDAAGASRRTRLVTVSAPAFTTPPVAPEDVQADVDWSGVVTLEWPRQTSATDGHQVYIDGELAGWVVGDGAWIPGVAPGTHTFEVTSLNSAGESAKSPPVTATV